MSIEIKRREKLKMKVKFKIKGLDCANCAAELERRIQKIEGIDNASISFMMERLEIEFGESQKEEVVKKLVKTIKKEEPDVKLEEI